MKEAQELREATEDYFAQPLDVSCHAHVLSMNRENVF